MNEKILSYLDDLEASGEDLRRLVEHVAIPSVSARPEHAGDVRRSAEHVRDKLASLGFTAEIWETEGHPSAYGEWRHPEGDAKPTLLIYGHHDVQPVEPLELWHTPPFAATERDGKLYGRGTIDDKGQVWCHLNAIEAWMAVEGGLPCNLKIIAEGEEEIGSANFAALMEREKARLTADAVVVSDTPMLGDGVASICYGLRGLAYCEITLRAFDGDLHSGMYGGTFAHPAHELARLITTLHDAEGRVAAEGFYDGVPELSDAERAALAELPFDEAVYRDAVQARGLQGEAGYTTLERLWARPTCDVMGLFSGYTGAGAKTILPAEATAKISCRLVPGQDPGHVLDCLRRHFEAHTPETVALTFTAMHGATAWLQDTSHPAFQGAEAALSKVFDGPTRYIRNGGTIPFVQMITDVLQRPALLVGFGLPNENAHAPNEWIDIANYRKGARACAWLYETITNAIIAH
ncbi:MAG: dipeptidase [Planctomycetota bacterium]|jgi:acetylornithine deacetylase/succinyl-diaminopimelate desuccinylase-like protein